MKLRLIAEPGDTVDQVAWEAWRKAQQTCWPVEVIHNDRRVVVTASDTPTTVADRIRETTSIAYDDGSPIDAFMTGFNDAIKRRPGEQQTSARGEE